MQTVLPLRQKKRKTKRTTSQSCLKRLSGGGSNALTHEEPAFATIKMVAPEAKVGTEDNYTEPVALSTEDHETESGSESGSSASASDDEGDIGFSALLSLPAGLPAVLPTGCTLQLNCPCKECKGARLAARMQGELRDRKRDRADLLVAAIQELSGVDEAAAIPPAAQLQEDATAVFAGLEGLLSGGRLSTGTQFDLSTSTVDVPMGVTVDDAYDVAGSSSNGTSGDINGAGAAAVASGMPRQKVSRMPASGSRAVKKHECTFLANCQCPNCVDDNFDTHL